MKIHFIVNTELRERVSSGIKEICEHYGISYTPLENIEKIGGHPTKRGMELIKNQLLSGLK